MLKQSRTRESIVILDLLTGGVIAFLLCASAVMAQPVQTMNSETQLGDTLCRQAADEPANELLLNKNSRLVKDTLLNNLLSCASSERYKQSAASRLEIYKLSVRVAQHINKPELIATAYYYLAQTYSVMSDVDNSLQAYETSRGLFLQAGIKSALMNVLAELGSLYFAQEEYENARSYSEQSLMIVAQRESAYAEDLLPPVNYARARALQTLGELDAQHAEYDEAMKKLGESFALYEGLNGSGSSYNKQVADVLIAQAKVYGETGQYGRALSFLTRAHQVSGGPDNQETTANIMSVQGALFLEQEDYASAEKYLNASLDIYKSLGNAKEEARVFLRKAFVAERKGRKDEALLLFRQSLDRAKAGSMVDMQIVAGEGVAIVLTAKRDFPGALRSLNQSLELARRVNAKTREVELLCLKAHTYYAMQNYSQSAAVAAEALTRARSQRLPKLAYLSAGTLGKSYAAGGQVELAITTLKEAVNETEAMRIEVAGRQESQNLFFENKVGPYHTLVTLLTKQGQNFEALGYAERAKSRVLLEAVRNNRSDLKEIYSEDEKTEAESLIGKLHTINQQIKAQPLGKPTNVLQTELDGVQRELVLFQERLAAAHPDLPLRAGPVQPLTQADLNNLVRADNVVFLEYVVTEDKVGVFVLKNKGLNTPELKFISLAVNVEELRRKVIDFQAAVAERQPGYEPLSRELYQILLRPIANELQRINTICIVPDEFLWALPFQALADAGGTYLIQDYSLFYAHSFTVLKEMGLRRPQQRSKESLIALANPVIETDPNLKQNLQLLPEAEAEVAAIATAVGTQISKTLVGPQAQEKTFKKLAQRYATIHLATHGVLDDRDPLNSYLLLTRTDADPENDGLLTAREIMDLHLNADLVVLSACETARGRISRGEGVTGMSWAFFVAGARSMVVSQWRVNSGSTSQLMKSFYQALARQDDLTGRDKAEALREASLNLLKDRRYRHPFYWAGFVLVSTN